MAQETWYVLEDGGVAHPRDVSHDGKGFVTEDGRRVARRPGVDAFSTRSVDPEAEAAKAPAAPKRGRPRKDSVAEAEVDAADDVANDLNKEKAAPDHATRDMSSGSYKNRGF